MIPQRARSRLSCVALRACAVCLSFALVASACFVDGQPDRAAVSLSLGLGGVTKGGPVNDGADIRLDVRPCYVGARVTAMDLAAPVVAAWACDPGEEPGGEVELDLEVASGLGRELQVVVFLAEPEGLVTLTSFATLDLAPGSVDVDVALVEAPLGEVDGYVTGADRDVVAAYFVDLETGVELPAVPATASGAGFHFTTDRLPRGRFFGLRLELVGGDILEISDCPVYAAEGSVRVLHVDAASGSC